MSGSQAPGSIKGRATLLGYWATSDGDRPVDFHFCCYFRATTAVRVLPCCVPLAPLCLEAASTCLDCVWVTVRPGQVRSNQSSPLADTQNTATQHYARGLCMPSTVF
ncbi:unnamed protein product [Pleuronectes platessa]|uniref:Uncharacterized protein n=1 Tax=Pleuronectes platessa TaxID=8262 RepID=A0A9N7YHP6_PLEPL|nr:unnamed protein product [Pleuronectes platessa]